MRGGTINRLSTRFCALCCAWLTSLRGVSVLLAWTLVAVQAQTLPLAVSATGKPPPSPYYNHSAQFSRAPADCRQLIAVPGSLFDAVLALAPPGPDRARRAVESLNRSIPFFRGILFRPKFDSALEQVTDRMPPRETTLIKAPAL